MNKIVILNPLPPEIKPKPNQNNLNQTKQNNGEKLYCSRFCYRSYNNINANTNNSNNNKTVMRCDRFIFGDICIALKLHPFIEIFFTRP